MAAPHDVHVKLETINDDQSISRRECFNHKSSSPRTPDRVDKGARSRSSTTGSSGPRQLGTSTMAEFSTALISPGFSVHVLTNESVRDNIRETINVRNHQNDIIQQRLNESEIRERASDDRPVQKKTPQRLSLNSSERVERALQTAPTHGTLRPSSARHQVPYHHHQQQQRVYQQPQQYTHQYHTQYYQPQQPMLRRHSRPCPYERPVAVHDAEMLYSVKTPGLFPPVGHGLTPPLSSGRRGSVALDVSLRQPITPPMERTEGGLVTLSRAARLKTMKESYMQACNDSFDALHGLDA